MDRSRPNGNNVDTGEHPAGADGGGPDLESLFFLRLPEKDSAELSRRLASDESRARGTPAAPSNASKRGGTPADSIRDYMAIKFEPNDPRRAVVRLTDDNGKSVGLYGKLLDMPCIVEVAKTLDRKNFYKVADMCQLLNCTAAPQPDPPPHPKHPERSVQHMHGVTPPMRNVRKRRFRRTLKKKFMDAPELERELKRLLRADMAAEGVKWELAAAAPEPSSSGGGGNAATADAAAAAPAATAAAVEPPAVDVADVFGGAVSSSSDEENEGGAGKKKGKDVS